MKSKLIAMEPYRPYHDCHALCHRPAVFFCHFRLTVFFIPARKNSFLGAFAQLRKAAVSFVMSAVRLSELNDSAPNGRIFMQV